jgi:hypothetical protein
MQSNLFFDRDEINAFIQVIKAGKLDPFCRTVFLEAVKNQPNEDGKEFMACFILHEYISEKQFAYHLGLEIGKRISTRPNNSYPWQTNN